MRSEFHDHGIPPQLFHLEYQEESPNEIDILSRNPEKYVYRLTKTQLTHDLKLR